jgi:hypothetical protein
MSDISAVPFRTVNIDGVPSHAFGGFPHLITRIAQGFHHITLLPQGSVADLAHSAFLQWAANRLPVCLCLDWDVVVFVQRYGLHQPSTRLPYAPVYVADAIHPCPHIGSLDADDPRPEQLEEFFEAIGMVDGIPAAEFVVNPLKGGWEDRADDRALLLGSGVTGIPYGLFRCPECGDFRGCCLDPSYELRGITMPVSCKCVNDTYCALCGEPFDEHQLDSNYYDQENNAVVHVPAYLALSHTCRPDEGRVG